MTTSFGFDLSPQAGELRTPLYIPDHPGAPSIIRTVTRRAPTAFRPKSFQIAAAGTIKSTER